ncbi:hypothetical protein GGI25_005557 [Coemansia spiralis]|uniref:B box-type domain-containing protein n=2 Tax=Coemansia TaxID=4863 RepID=A0A9W8G3X7_9FUNG|nr:hypothetical protein EDC05_005624 [Coemansia umbellata]KAJ2622648.1 hypothetical protein GGI26_003094 [Coemansia sp. RSA 1358]KAJ2671284.1 hypothetical protein GGI25_005557 [Coemansia spiralis]
MPSAFLQTLLDLCTNRTGKIDNDRTANAPAPPSYSSADHTSASATAPLLPGRLGRNSIHVMQRTHEHLPHDTGYADNPSFPAHDRLPPARPNRLARLLKREKPAKELLPASRQSSKQTNSCDDRRNGGRASLSLHSPLHTHSSASSTSLASSSNRTPNPRNPYSLAPTPSQRLQRRHTSKLAMPHSQPSQTNAQRHKQTTQRQISSTSFTSCESPYRPYTAGATPKQQTIAERPLSVPHFLYRQLDTTDNGLVDSPMRASYTVAGTSKPASTASAQSSGTYADATVASSFLPSSTPPPRQRNRQRNNSHSECAANQESSPVSIYTLAEPAQNEEKNAKMQLEAYVEVSPLALKSKGVIDVDALQAETSSNPLTVAAATVASMSGPSKPQLSTLVEDESADESETESADAKDVNTKQQTQESEGNDTTDNDDGDDNDDSDDGDNDNDDNDDSDDSDNDNDDELNEEFALGSQPMITHVPEHAETAIHSDRCSVHPGSRKDLWCQTCEDAICYHCVDSSTALHSLHSVVKLSVAYDDTFEAIDAMQIKLVRNLTETRQQNALYDAALTDLHGSYKHAEEIMSKQIAQDMNRVDDCFNNAYETLQHRIEGCAKWRDELEEALTLIQIMNEEFSQAQAVAERSHILSVLMAASQARPESWSDELPNPSQLVDAVKPQWRFATLHVPNVLDLGRKRGHVRVVSDPFSAHGMVWQVEARRSRNKLGEPCLSITVTCIEGGETLDSPCTVSVHLVGAPAMDMTPLGHRGSRLGVMALDLGVTEQFRQQHSDGWKQAKSHSFSVCSLDNLRDCDVLSDSGSVTVRFGVCPESFRTLALAQEERIRVLESRIKSRQHTSSHRSEECAAGDTLSVVDGNGSSITNPGDRLSASLRPNRRRRSESRGWATSPRPSRRSDAHVSQVRMRQVLTPEMPSSPHQASSLPQQLGGFTFSSDNLETAPGLAMPVQENSSPSLLSPISRIPRPPRKQSLSQHSKPLCSPPVVSVPVLSKRFSADNGQDTAIHKQTADAKESSGASSLQTLQKILSQDALSDLPQHPFLSKSSEKNEHRRATSLTTKLRRQPPIPFPLTIRTRSMQSASSSPPSTNMSQLSIATESLGSKLASSRTSSSLNDEKAGMLRRLSGWMKTTEGKFAQQAKRVRQLAGGANGSSQQSEDKVDDIDDWTFLDKSLSPVGLVDTASLNSLAVGVAENGSPLSIRAGRRPLWSHRNSSKLSDLTTSPSVPPTYSLPPPSIPLPPLPASSFEPAGDQLCIDDIEEGFAFDGAADIEREQAEVDARAKLHLELIQAETLADDDVVDIDMPSPSDSLLSNPCSQTSADAAEDIQARYASIMQRVDALQLIANTVENSRDGFTEGTLRRISSELGVLMDGRRRRLEEARAHGLGSSVTSPRSQNTRMRKTISSHSQSANDFSFTDHNTSRKGSTASAHQADGSSMPSALPKPPPRTESRRSFSMDNTDIRRALARSGIPRLGISKIPASANALQKANLNNQQQPMLPSPSKLNRPGSRDLTYSLNGPPANRNRIGGTKLESKRALASSSSAATQATAIGMLLSPELSRSCRDAYQSLGAAALKMYVNSPIKEGAGSVAPPPPSSTPSAYGFPVLGSGRQSRRTSVNSVGSSSSSTQGRPSLRITRPDGGASARRESFSTEPACASFANAHSNAALALRGSLSVKPGLPVSAGNGEHTRQLTPQANRQGGILKAGRQKRTMPSRLQMLPDLPSLEVVSHAAVLPGRSQIATPQGPGRFTEYESGTPTSAASTAISPQGKSGRSSTLPPALMDSVDHGDSGTSSGSGAKRIEPSTPSTRDAASANRQVRSARAARKRVRFPEEKRFLETIRLIDPQVAQSIETRAAAARTPADGGDPVKSAAASRPPVFDLNSGLSKQASSENGVAKQNTNASNGNSDAGNDDIDVPLSGLAARIRSSPRLSARPASGQPEPSPFALDDDNAANNEADSDDVFSSSPALSVGSPGRFDTAISLLFDEATDQPILPPAAASAAYQRPPLPPLHFFENNGTSRPVSARPLVRKNSGGTTDGSCKSTRGAHNTVRSHSGEREQGRAPDSFASAREQLRFVHSRDAARGRKVGALERIQGGRRGMHVGPNVGSAQSSPVQQECPASGSNISSPLSDGGATGSGHLCPVDVSVFGEEHIPAVACGRNTAFKGRRAQGPDAVDGST